MLKERLEKIADSSYAKDFVAGIDPSGTGTFANAFDNEKNHKRHKAVGNAGGFIGGAVSGAMIPAALAGAGSLALRKKNPETAKALLTTAKGSVDALNPKKVVKYTKAMPEIMKMQGKASKVTSSVGDMSATIDKIKSGDFKFDDIKRMVTDAKDTIKSSSSLKEKSKKISDKYFDGKGFGEGAARATTALSTLGAAGIGGAVNATSANMQYNTALKAKKKIKEQGGEAMNNERTAYEVIGATFEKVAARRMDKYIADVAKMDKGRAAMAKYQMNNAVNTMKKTVDPLAQRQAVKSAVQPYMESVAKGQVVPDKAVKGKNVFDLTKGIVNDAKGSNEKILKGDAIRKKDGNLLRNRAGKVVHEEPVQRVNRAYQDSIKKKEDAKKAAELAKKKKTIGYQVETTKNTAKEEIPKIKKNVTDAVKNIGKSTTNSAEAVAAGEIETLRNAAKKFVSKENIDKHINEENAKKVVGMGKDYYTNNKDKIHGMLGLGGGAGIGAGLKKVVSKGAKQTQKAIATPPAPKMTTMQKANDFVRKNPVQAGLGAAAGAGALGGAYSMGKGSNEKTAFETVDCTFEKIAAGRTSRVLGSAANMMGSIGKNVKKVNVKNPFKTPPVVPTPEVAKPATFMEKADKAIKGNSMVQGATNFAKTNPTLTAGIGASALGGSYALGKNSEKTASEIINNVLNQLDC